MYNPDAENKEPWVQAECSGLPLTLQSLIDALIDIDVAYERECQELSNCRLGATLSIICWRNCGCSTVNDENPTFGN